MYWVVLTNTNLYRIYQFEKGSEQLSLLKEISHPESKSKSSDLGADRPGHYGTSSNTRGAYSPHATPKEDEIDKFLRMLADELEAGRTNNHYEGLILISPPKVNGTLAKHLNKNVEQLIIKDIKKDHTHFAIHELKKFMVDNKLFL